MACTRHSKRQGCKFFVKVILALVDFKKFVFDKGTNEYKKLYLSWPT